MTTASEGKISFALSHISLAFRVDLQIDLLLVCEFGGSTFAVSCQLAGRFVVLVGSIEIVHAADKVFSGCILVRGGHGLLWLHALWFVGGLVELAIRWRVQGIASGFLP